MKSINNMTLAILVVFLCSVIAWIIGIFAWSSMTKKSTLSEKIYSPSNKKYIVPVINTSQDDMQSYLTVKLNIHDKDTGKLLFEVQTGASNQMSWSVQWLTEELIELSSSDVGSLCWQEATNGNWLQVECPK